MQALIIGCGYLGRRVAALWRSQAHEVFALTRSTQNAAALRNLRIEPIIGDVLEPASLRSLPAADVVLYAVGYDKQAGAAKREVYVQGLENVLREISPRVSRFLYVSSTSVYGQDGGEWIDETSPCVPLTEDGQICLAAEQTVWRFFPPDPTVESSSGTGSLLPVSSDRVAAHRRAELPVLPANVSGRGAIVLRFSGIYGPDRLLRRIESVRKQEPIRANPEGSLNLIHVDDGARLVAAIAERGRLGATYLVTDNKPVRRREYYALLAKLVGAPAPLFQCDAAAARHLNKRCSNARLRAELGDLFQFPTLDVGLPDAITNGSALPPT
jgi:nucleoside-diphosphate-sugar epimerase